MSPVRVSGQKTILSFHAELHELIASARFGTFRPSSCRTLREGGDTVRLRLRADRGTKSASRATLGAGVFWVFARFAPKIPHYHPGTPLAYAAARRNFSHNVRSGSAGHG